MNEFDYDLAFSRNIGWFTKEEQNQLRSKRVAIAGMGGVGGNYLLTLTRLGIGGFHIADFDIFAVENFNRQVGASLESVGKPKLDTMVNLAKQINPQLDIQTFPQGITFQNIPRFLSGCDLYLDGLDFFVLPIRRLVFAKAYEFNIPAVTAAPLGMGTALLNFRPPHMSFENYFNLNGKSAEEQMVRFLLGLAPARLQQKYLVDKSTVDLKQHKGPSTIIGCQLCSGLAVGTVVKILLNRGKVLYAPHGLHFDAYRNKFKHTYKPFGGKGPLQKLIVHLALKRFNAIFSGKSSERSHHASK